MKKFALAGIAAIALMAVSQQHASAWVNSKFGVGLNWNYQAGGNNLLWGAWRNGQPPGPEAFGGGGGGQFNPGYHAPMPQPYSSMPQGFAPQGYAPQGFAPMPQGYAPQGYAPSPQGSFEPTMIEPPLANGYYSPYQFANYSRPVYYYYYPTPYYYGR